MKLELKRFEFGDKYTIGKLYIDGVYHCYTLEDKVREEKVQNETAIPTGTYAVVIDHSNRFSRDLPHILNVPNFEGVRIHIGNSSKDTQGCILLGNVWTKGDFIGNSKIAFDSFFHQLQKAKTATLVIT